MPNFQVSISRTVVQTSLTFIDDAASWSEADAIARAALEEDPELDWFDSAVIGAPTIVSVEELKFAGAKVEIQQS
jgi:hypothetical protein